MKKIFKALLWVVYYILSIPLIIINLLWALWEWDIKVTDSLNNHIFNDVLNKVFKP